MPIDSPMPNIDRLWGRLQKLAEFTVPGSPWTRRAFSPEFAEARRWLEAEFQRAGLDVTLDSGGNLIGRLPGADLELKPLVTGSHCDTVVAGGRFDGIIGVLGGLEVAQTLRECGRRLHHSLEVIDFLSEEPSDYGISCVGSRALSGRLDTQMLAAVNPAGETLAAAIARIGGDPQMLKSPLRRADGTAAFVELHIEQGPVLETLGLPIGVVTNIVGIHRVTITLTGQADHAGTTPMSMRRDALVGAARVIERAHSMASEPTGSAEYLVATVGRLAVWPNAPNAVPARVDMVLEVRSDATAILDSFPEKLVDACMKELAELGIHLDMQTLTYSSPTACSPIVIEAVARAAASIGHRSRRMTSGAGHDAIYVAPTGPIGMIFVPCRGGRSHCAEEWIEPGQLLDGTRVLMQTLLDLDDSLP
jgi:beta-ureidopropionase / N-carbamoyl-L-amino-acid hydrolase